MFKYSAMLNILLCALCITIFYKYDTERKKVEVVKLECARDKAVSDNQILKNNIAELERIKLIQANQHKKFLEVNNELIAKHEKITADVADVNLHNDRLLTTAEEARSKAFTAAINADNRTEALREYATIREGLHEQCKTALIDVAEDATRLQQKVLEFDKKWDIQADTLNEVLNNKKPVTD